MTVKQLKDVENQRGYLLYTRDVLQGYSPAAGRLLTLAIKQFDMAFEEAARGERLLWTTLKCIPLIYASGYKPLMLADIVRFGESELIPEAECFFHIPAEICTMIKAEYGTLYQYRDSGIDRLLISPYLQCEPTILMASAMKQYGYDVYMADVVERPKHMSEKRNTDFKEQLRREYTKISTWLCENGINRDKLRTELERSNRMKDKVAYLETLEMRHNLYLKTVTSMLARCGVESYYAQPELFEEILDELIGEMESLAPGAYYDPKLPELVWSGARGVDFSAFIAVDMAGGHVAYWNLICNLEKRYDLSLDPFEALVKHDFETSEALDIKEACDADERHRKTVCADGIILFQTQGCTYNSVSYELRRREFTDRNIPVLLLTGNTQNGEVNGQTLIRLEAFMEMVRKK